MRPIWAWLRLYLTPKGDHTETDNQIRAIVILTALEMLTQYDGVFFFIDISLRPTLRDACMGKNIGSPS